MFKIGDYLTPASYKEGAIWATANRAQINPDTWCIEALPEPTKEEQSANREVAYQQNVDPITCHISRLMDEEQTDSVYKVYISPLTPLNVDRHNYVSTTDNRLIRRIVRDYRTRGRSAEASLATWGSVRVGEEKYIFPYTPQ